MQTTPQANLRDWIADQDQGDEGVVLMDGFDDCVVGLAEHFNFGPVLVYDREKIIDKLVADGMDHDDAWEHFYFNIAGSYVGKRTPMFLTARHPQD
jgi:hypothetical protein